MMSTPESTANLIAVAVMNSPGCVILSPFFGKSDGILRFDPAGEFREFDRNEERTSEYLCKLLLGARVRRLICGFIGPNEKARLAAAGVDIRLGSCTTGVEDLVDRFYELPKA